MFVSARSSWGAAAVSVASLALVSGSLSPAVGSGAAARLAPTPLLKLTITKSDFMLSGPRTFRAGRVAVSLTSRAEGSAGFVRFKKGYTFKQFRADVQAAFSGDPDGMKFFRRAVRKTTFFGGLGPGGTRTTTGTVVLPKAGRYIVFTFGQSGPAHPKRLRVTGPPVHRAVPATDGVVRARSGARWGGSKTLPNRGTIKFKNAATDSPHFLIMQHVAKGTTRKEIIDALNAPDGSPPPTFFREGSFETDVLSPGRSMTVDYRVPKGTYAQLCFFPDLVSGMPHAMMGMVRIVILK